MTFASLYAMRPDELDALYLEKVGKRPTGAASHRAKVERILREVHGGSRRQVSYIERAPKAPVWSIPADDEVSRTLMAVLRNGATMDDVLTILAAVRLGRGIAAPTPRVALSEALRCIRFLADKYGYGLRTVGDNIEAYI